MVLGERGIVLWMDILKKTLKVGLIEGRHEMPVDEYIFQSLPQEGSLKDKIPQLQAQAQDWIEDKGPTSVDLYVTGMTPVLTAFLKAWNRWVKAPEWGTLTLYHYDISTKTYWSEEW
jgi:hypothetical protein